MKDEDPPTEAEEYFSALDQAIPGPIHCDNCGYEMDKNFTHLHKLSGARKCSTEMAYRIAVGEKEIPDDEWKLLEEAYQAKLRRDNPLPQAFRVKKPSVVQRLLDWLF